MALVTSVSNTTLLLSASVIALLGWVYWKLLVKPIPGIPYNKHSAYTLLGDVPGAIKAAEEDGVVIPWMTSHFEKHQSAIVQLFALPFVRPWVMISDFREIQDILLRRTKEFDRSEATGVLFAGAAPHFHIHMKSDDEEFKSNKALLRDLMTPAFLHTVAAPYVHASVSNLIDFWSLKARTAQEKPLKARDDIRNCILDAMSGVSFGLAIEDGTIAGQIQNYPEQAVSDIQVNEDGVVEFDEPVRPPTHDALFTLLETVEGAIKAPVAAIYYWYKLKTPTYRNAHRIKEQMITDELEKGLVRFKEGSGSQKSALDNLLQREEVAAKKAGRPPNFHSRPIYDEVLGFLLGGFDTTSNTLSWGVKFLSADQNVQGLLRKSLRHAFPDAARETRNPTVDEILKSHVPYLDATIEEINRHSQMVGMTLRRTLVDTVILGHKIPKGTDVCLALSGPNTLSAPFPVSDDVRSPSSRDAKHQYGTWNLDDIADFKPERWLKSDEKGEEIFDPMAGPSMPFSAGPRGCFGRRLAYIQLRIVLVMVIWNFELLPIEGELASFKAEEKITRAPTCCYLRLKQIEREAIRAGL